MCLISSQPSSETGIAQVLMRRLLLGTPERAVNQLGQKEKGSLFLQAGGSVKMTARRFKL